MYGGLAHRLPGAALSRIALVWPDPSLSAFRRTDHGHFFNACFPSPFNFGTFPECRVDAKTGKITLHETPTKASGPRRAIMDAQDRLWFAQYRGNKIGVFDTKTEKFQEWPMTTPRSQPYDVALDKNGDVWTGSMLNDRVVRLDPKTGKTVDYLLPRSTNIRRVYVDNTTATPTFWVGSNHGASIIKLEPLE